MKRQRGSMHRRPLGLEGVSRPEHDDPGTAAARARVTVLLERMSRVNLEVVVVGPPDAARLTARERARTAAIAAGRGALLEQAMKTTRDAVIRAFARSGFSGTWAATAMSMSVIGPADRVAAATAFEEAAMAAVVEDLIDAEALEILRGASDEITGLKDIPSPGSLSGFGSLITSAAQGPVRLVVGVVGIVLVLIGVEAASIVIWTVGVVILVGLVLGRRRDATT